MAKLTEKEKFNIINHYRKYFTMAGARDSGFLLKEILDDDICVDLVHFLPTAEFNYHIFATIGMSAYTMKKVPYKNIELIMILPGDWKTGQDVLEDEKWCWPIRLLKTVAKFPYNMKVSVSYGHTFSANNNENPINEYTEMCCGILTFPTWFDYGIFKLKQPGIFGKKVNFLCLTTLTKPELKYKEKFDVKKLFDELLQRGGKDDLVVRDER